MVLWTRERERREMWGDHNDQKKDIEDRRRSENRDGHGRTMGDSNDRGSIGGGTSCMWYVCTNGGEGKDRVDGGNGRKNEKEEGI